MCLIIVLQKGTDKYSDIVINGIKNSAVTNKDGIGYSYKKANGKVVYYDKGYTAAIPFIEQYKSKKLKDEDEVIIHLRNGNVGNNHMINCHPFPISADEKELSSIIGGTNIGTLAHNGTFYKYNSYNNTNGYSDTYKFVKEFINIPEVLSVLKRDKILFKELFKDYVGYTNKIAFLFTDVGIITHGDFLEAEGCLFSNLSYKDNKYEDKGGERVNRSSNSHARKGKTYDNKNINWMNGLIPGMGYGSEDADINYEHTLANDKRTFAERVIDEIEYVTRQNKAESKVINLTDYNNQLQHIDIELNRTIVKEIALISRKTRDKFILKDEVYMLDEDYLEDGAWNYVYNLKKKTTLMQVTTERLNDPKEFIKVPTKAYKEKYRDYMKLVKTVNPTRSYIKKLFKKLGRAHKHNDINIAGIGRISIYAARLFMDRYKFMLDKDKYKEYKERMANKEYQLVYD